MHDTTCDEMAHEKLIRLCRSCPLDFLRMFSLGLCFVSRSAGIERNVTVRAASQVAKIYYAELTRKKYTRMSGFDDNDYEETGQFGRNPQQIGDEAEALCDISPHQNSLFAASFSWITEPTAAATWMAHERPAAAADEPSQHEYPLHYNRLQPGGTTFSNNSGNNNSVGSNFFSNNNIGNIWDPLSYSASLMFPGTLPLASNLSVAPSSDSTESAFFQRLAMQTPTSLSAPFAAGGAELIANSLASNSSHPTASLSSDSNALPILLRNGGGESLGILQESRPIEPGTQLLADLPRAQMMDNASSPTSLSPMQQASSSTSSRSKRKRPTKPKSRASSTHTSADELETERIRSCTVAPLQLSVKVTERRAYRHEPFPQKVHRMLRETTAAGQDNIISWTPCGKAFEVHDHHGFEQDVIPKYFRHSRLASFRRQLSMYGFRRAAVDNGYGGFAHEHFHRDHPERCATIKRVSEMEVTVLPPST